MMYISGVTYYISSTINPILYNVMSAKYRQDTVIVYYMHKKFPHMEDLKRILLPTFLQHYYYYFILENLCVAVCRHSAHITDRWNRLDSSEVSKSQLFNGPASTKFILGPIL